MTFTLPKGAGLTRDLKPWYSAEQVEQAYAQGADYALEQLCIKTGVEFDKVDEETTAEEFDVYVRDTIDGVLKEVPGRKDYDDAMDSIRVHVRDLDQLMNGDDAATWPLLIDIKSQLETAIRAYLALTHKDAPQRIDDHLKGFIPQWECVSDNGADGPFRHVNRSTGESSESFGDYEASTIWMGRRIAKEIVNLFTGGK